MISERGDPQSCISSTSMSLVRSKELFCQGHARIANSRDECGTRIGGKCLRRADGWGADVGSTSGAFVA